MSRKCKKVVSAFYIFHVGALALRLVLRLVVRLGRAVVEMKHGDPAIQRYKC